MAPENTLASFRAAFAQGADGIEGDYYLTKDGQIICLHDATTERVAGVSRVVRESTFAELRALDVGIWKGEAFRGEKMPTLDEVMAIVPAGKLLYVEVKCGPEIVPKLVETLEAGPVKPEQITVIAFDEAVVHELRSRAPKFSAFWLVGIKPDVDGTAKPSASSAIATLKRSLANGLGFSADPPTDSHYVAEIKKAGFQTNVWTVNSPEVARRFVTFGVDAITTDVPGVLREALVAGSE